MADEGSETPEGRAYANDKKFRRFAEVMRINPPVVELEATIVDFEEKFKVNWVEDSKKPLQKTVKESFMKWNYTKQAWRKHLPKGLVQAASLTGAAPKLNLQTDSSETQVTEDEQQTRTASLGKISINLILLLCIASYIYTAWPLWKSIIDPEATGHYKVLGVERDASMKDIKKAFRKLALAHHPDKTLPGSYDAVKYQRIKEAYEALKSQRDEAGEVTGFSDSTKEANLRVLMFIGFFLGRIYEISYHGAEFILRLIDTQDITTSKYLYLVLHIVCMALFLWDNGGMGDVLVLLINAWTSISNILQRNQIKLHPDHNHVKWETRYYLLFVVAPAISASLYRSWAFVDGNFIGKLVMGCIYVASFIMRHRPYIFLTWSLSSRAYSGGNPLFERSFLLNFIPCPLFVRYIIEVVIDDLLAHAMNVPAPFRIACFAVLAVSFLQANFYPSIGILSWGTPDKWNKTEAEIVRMKEKKAGAEDAKARKEDAGERREANKIIDEAINRDKKTLSAKEKKDARKQLVEEEKGSKKSIKVLLYTLTAAGGFCSLLVVLDGQLSGKGFSVSPELQSILKGFSRALVIP
eukprot:TRINITY_DN3082_c0_g1_i2.p1 TRINITY_DN3082_c0_g1~~TRINITY_DN3082_c0_g1_i2.p1  ORF type:complete len:594 (+),score=130.87 TRINITY_DN3082_c0_g1_i2:44-1783(+)